MPDSNRFHLRLPSESASASPRSGETLPISKAVSSAKGTVPFLHPTHAHIHLDHTRLDWNSRDHRKGRHPLPQGQRRRIHTILRIEYWNVSWWVAVVIPRFRDTSNCELFTLGSAVWVINGFLVFLPELNAMAENDAAEGWTAFVGGTLFEFGGYMMILESLNRKHEVRRRRFILTPDLLRRRRSPRLVTLFSRFPQSQIKRR